MLQTVEENKELQRRITVHIVTVCEQLFGHYIDKAQSKREHQKLHQAITYFGIRQQLGRNKLGCKLMVACFSVFYTTDTFWKKKAFQ